MDGQPEPGRAVLVTRPEPEAAATAARLAALGFAPVCAPLLTITALPAALPDPAGVQAVLVTSPRAVPALGPAYRAVRLLAVGAASAAAARRAGQLCVLSAEGDAEDLQRLAQTQCRPGAGSLLLLSGRGEGARLAAGLARRFTVARRFVYAAEPVDALPAAAAALLRGAASAASASRPVAALFYSAATARTFVSLAEAAGLRETLTGVEALAISAATASALAALPWRRIRVASRPNQDELLALLR